MKTKNNAQKTKTGKMMTTTIAAVLTLALLATSAKSQDALQQRSTDTLSSNTFELTSLQNIASNVLSAELNPSEKSHATNLNRNHQAFWINDENEEMLTIENWMISNSYFNSSECLNADDQDKPLEIESWMTDDKIWK